MNDIEKKARLKKYKTVATGLFLLMCVVFMTSVYLQKYTGAGGWAGYLRAFSEAGMVGALADWFAVTALFHHPLGLRIPHTNLIEESKERIGDNLGDFVVSNFLSPENIRPYISNLRVSQFAGEWLSNEGNQRVLIKEIAAAAGDILGKLDDEAVVNFISSKASEFAEGFKINKVVGTGLEYLLNRNDHQKIVTNLAKEIREYVIANQSEVHSRVKRESFSLIPRFVDDAIAEKIVDGLAGFFQEVESNRNHSLRAEITEKMLVFAKDVQADPSWEEEFDSVRASFLAGEKLHLYSRDIWLSVKKSLLKEFADEDSAFRNYARQSAADLAVNLQTDEALQQKIDGWVRQTAYKQILRNTHCFSGLISSTVGNWQGRELSEKLELEVGRDLQFIRVNGTLVGGLVGLLIYMIAQLV